MKQVAGTLSGGEQQMVATARALMARPRVLLMDEPSMGLSPVMVEQVFETIRTINQQGVTILLVEQNALLALSIADRAYVLESGRVVLLGPRPRADRRREGAASLSGLTTPCRRGARQIFSRRGGDLPRDRKPSAAFSRPRIMREPRSTARSLALAAASTASALYPVKPSLRTPAPAP